MIEKQSLYSVGKISSELYSLSSYTVEKRSSYMKTAIDKYDFDVIGIRDDAGIVQTYYDKYNNINNIKISEICSIDIGIECILEKLKSKSYLFLMTENGIDHIVTIADLDKPEFHIYLFMLFSKYENILTEKIKSKIEKLTLDVSLNKVIKIAKNNASRRKKDNSNLHFAYYLLFSEKLDVYKKLNLSKSLLIDNNYEKGLVNLRNCLAHGNSLFKDIKIDQLSYMEAFLKKVTKIA